jgi:5S rRNA maturation endonuclease (ribonuclease M5)
MAFALYWGQNGEERKRKTMMRDNEKILIDIFTSLDTEYPSLFIIVEGKRDERVLRDLGVKSKIIKTQSGRQRSVLVDGIVKFVEKQGQVLILTDYDDEGIELQKYIENELELHKIKILRRLRKKIRKAMGNWRCIEEMVALFKRKDSPEPRRIS